MVSIYLSIYSFSWARRVFSKEPYICMELMDEYIIIVYHIHVTCGYTRFKYYQADILEQELALSNLSNR